MDAFPEGWLLDRGVGVLFVGLILAAARPLALIFVLPLFTRFGLQEGLVRGGILVAFAAPVFPGLTEDMALTGPPEGARLALLIAKELFVGLLLGLILGVPLWAVAAAGDMVELQRGASMATLVDPGSGEDTTPLGTLLFLLTAWVLVTSGWFTEVILASLYGTYAAWPVLASVPPLEPAAAEGALALLDLLLRTGLVLSIPLLGPLLLTEVAMGLAGRYTQQINVMFLAMSVKQIVFVLLLPLYFASLVYYVRGEIRDLGGAPEVLDGFLDPDAPADGPGGEAP